LEVFTIGFTKKSARQFFDSLKAANIKIVYDVRLNNKSQLSGFAKGADLEYFLRAIAGMKYNHLTKAAPTEELLKKWRKGEITWEQYEEAYLEMLKERDIDEIIRREDLNNACFLCSESTPEKCHRRLLVEYLKEKIPEIKITHI